MAQIANSPSPRYSPAARPPRVVFWINDSHRFTTTDLFNQNVKVEILFVSSTACVGSYSRLDAASDKGALDTGERRAPITNRKAGPYIA